MATRHRHGLYHYRPRTAANLGGKGSRGGGKPRPKPPTGPAGLSRPGTKRASRQAQRAGQAIHRGDPEYEHLRAGALAESLGSAEHAGYNELLHEYLADSHRKRYNAAAGERRRAKPRQHPLQRLSEWVKVRAYRRHRPRKRK